MSGAFLSRLPAVDRALLIGCAADPAAAEAGWAAWIAGLPADVPAGTQPYARHQRELLPLLAARLSGFSTAAPEWLAHRLRTAALIEEQRLVAVRDVSGEVLTLPPIRDADPLVIGGLALGETVYPTRQSRHTNSLRLMLPATISLRRIERDLTARGLAVQPIRWRSFRPPMLGLRGLVLRHPTGLMVILHRGGIWPLTHARLSAAAALIDAGSVRFRTPAPGDAFVLAAMAAGSDRRQAGLIWLADAVFLLRHLGGALRSPWILGGASRRLAALATAIDRGTA
jgi:hypothetical protein